MVVDVFYVLDENVVMRFKDNINEFYIKIVRCFDFKLRRLSKFILVLREKLF